MLGAIGAGSLDDLFADIPDSVRLGRPLDLPAGRSEQEVHDHLAALADSPEKINEDPYGDGWMVKVRLTDASEVDSLLDVGAYKDLL